MDLPVYNNTNQKRYQHLIQKVSADLDRYLAESTGSGSTNIDNCAGQKLNLAENFYECVIFLLTGYNGTGNREYLNTICQYYDNYAKSIDDPQFSRIISDMPFVGLTLYFLTGKTFFLESAEKIVKMHIASARKHLLQRHYLYKHLLFLLHFSAVSKNQYNLNMINTLVNEIINDLVVDEGKLLLQSFNQVKDRQQHISECRYLFYQLSRVFGNKSFTYIADHLTEVPDTSNTVPASNLSFDVFTSDNDPQAESTWQNAYFLPYISDLESKNLIARLEERLRLEDNSGVLPISNLPAYHTNYRDIFFTGNDLVDIMITGIYEVGLFDYRFHQLPEHTLSLNRFPALSITESEIKRAIMQTTFPNTCTLLWAEMPGHMLALLAQPLSLSKAHLQQDLIQLAGHWVGDDSDFFPCFKSSISLDLKRGQAGRMLGFHKHDQLMQQSEKELLMDHSATRFSELVLRLSNRIQMVEHLIHKSQNLKLFTFQSVMVESPVINIMLSYKNHGEELTEEYPGEITALVLQAFKNARAVSDAICFMVDRIEHDPDDRPAIEGFLLDKIRYFIMSDYLIA